MPPLPILASSDDRRARGIMPVRLRNCLLDPLPVGAGKLQPYAIVPRPGRVLVTTLSGQGRGLFAQDGVQGGLLFAASGSSIYSISAAGAATNISTIDGADVAHFGGLRANLVLRSGSSIYRYNGSALTASTDANRPLTPRTLAIVAGRALLADATDDLFQWSKPGLPLEFDPNGIAADFELPDPIVAQTEHRGDLISFNSKSTQRWQATGGIESEAFAPVLSATIRQGLLSTHAFARMNDDLCFIAEALTAYRINEGFTPLQNRDLTAVLQGLTVSDRAETFCSSWEDGERNVWITRLKGVGRGFAYDVMTGSWSEVTTYGLDQYDLAFSAQAYGATYVMGRETGAVWRLDRTSYTDAGEPIERIMTLRVMAGRDTPIDELALDLQCVDQPLTGQGSAPTAVIRASRDGGMTWDPPRTVNLPTPGQYGRRVQLWGMGLITREHGLTLEIVITDPIGFAITGAWINPTAEESLR